MSGWKTYKLGEIAEIIMGQSPSGETCNEKELGIPLLNGPTEFNTHFPIPVQYTTDPKKLSEIEDILFCVRGSTTGKMNWSDRRYAIGRGLAAIRHKHGKEYKHFLRGVIDSNLKNILGITTGSTFPNIGGEQLKEFEVIAPDLPTQKEIASILSSLDDRIELNLQMNQTLEAMAQAIFKEWFGNFNFPGFDGELVNGLPKGWRRASIGSFAKSIQYGYTQSSSSEEIGPKFLRITDIQNGIVDWNQVPYCPIDNKEFGKYKIQDHDIFVARTGASTGENIYIIEPPVAVFASYLIRVQFEKPEYAFYIGKFMRQQEYFNYIASSLGGSAQPNANAKTLTNIVVVVPEEGILKRYFELVFPFHKKIVTNQNENQTLTQLRDSLLPKLMSGKISLNTI